MHSGPPRKRRARNDVSLGPAQIPVMTIAPVVAPMASPAAAQATPILSINNIEVIYDRVILVLKGVSLDVPRGGIVALLGANGAGKTTTLKAISNLLHAERGEVTKGSIVHEGREVVRVDVGADARRPVVRGSGCERSFVERVDAGAVGLERHVKRRDLVALANPHHPVLGTQQDQAGPLHHDLRAKRPEHLLVEVPTLLKIPHRN